MEIFHFLDWGIAGIFAVCMFLIYRRACNQMRDDRKFMEDRLTDVIKEYNEAMKEGAEARNKFTVVITELTTWLQARNGHS